MKKIQINSIDLAYARHGKGTSLVLLHGFPLDHRIWDDVVPLLVDSFELIIPDLRGFGESTISDAPCTMNDFASDIAALLDHLYVKKTAIAGHSMGGYISLAFARLFPDRVTGLGLVASQTLADSPERKEGRYKSAMEVAEKGISGVVETMTPKFTPDAKLQMIVRKIMEAQQPAAYIASLKAMAERQDSTSLLDGAKYPVVVIHGDADALIPVERAREIKVGLPHARLVEIAGAGHLPMMQAAGQTAEALKRLA